MRSSRSKLVILSPTQAMKHFDYGGWSPRVGEVVWVKPEYFGVAFKKKEGGGGTITKIRGDGTFDVQIATSRAYRTSVCKTDLCPRAELEKQKAQTSQLQLPPRKLAMSKDEQRAEQKQTNKNKQKRTREKMKRQVKSSKVAIERNEIAREWDQKKWAEMNEELARLKEQNYKLSEELTNCKRDTCRAVAAEMDSDMSLALVPTYIYMCILGHGIILHARYVTGLLHKISREDVERFLRCDAALARARVGAKPALPWA